MDFTKGNFKEKQADDHVIARSRGINGKKILLEYFKEVLQVTILQVFVQRRSKRGLTTNKIECTVLEMFRNVDNTKILLTTECTSIRFLKLVEGNLCKSYPQITLE